jgi:hypothetical protein
MTAGSRERSPAVSYKEDFNFAISWMMIVFATWLVLKYLAIPGGPAQ